MHAILPSSRAASARSNATTSSSSAASTSRSSPRRSRGTISLVGSPDLIMLVTRPTRTTSRSSYSR
jgi:hypothetical protein